MAYYKRYYSVKDLFTTVRKNYIPFDSPYFEILAFSLTYLKD